MAGFCVGVISSRLKILIGLSLAAVAVGAIVVWRYREHLGEIDYQGLVDSIAGFGPIPFFLAMAILPSLWAPASPFLFLAGALYDLPLALGGSAAALGSNMALSWLLAGRLFRPLFERLVHRFGYSVPELDRNNMIAIAVLLRITPGVPFPFQNYLLGLARMPFGWYMGISLPITIGMAFGIILAGDAILKGNFAIALLAISLLIALSLAARNVQARLKRKSMEKETA